MQTLTYGFLLPQTGDKGAALFSALGSNITQLNNHTHDGQNSAPISAFSIASVQAQIPASGWQSFGGPIGEYRQLVQMAAGFTFLNNTMSFRDLLGNYCYPKVVMNDNISYYVYSNDPSVTFNVVYGG